MLQVDPAHFANVINAVQRTGSLTGGAVRGLPNGVVIEGLQGVSSFGSDIADAKKEFELGRVRTALVRVKQIENQFNGIAGRWNGTVGSLISGAKQGRQQLSLQKLNELKNAQAKMQQLTGPTNKALQDLVAALEHAVSMESRESDHAPETKSTSDDGIAGDPPEIKPMAVQPQNETADDTPDADVLGRFATNYKCGPKLQLLKNSKGKTRVDPKIEQDRFYFFVGLQPPRVVRVREIRRKALTVFDTHDSRDVIIESRELAGLIKQGVWLLV